MMSPSQTFVSKVVIAVADPGIFQRGGIPPLRLVFKGGPTIILGFQRGLHSQYALFLPYFDKIFWQKGGGGG
jgi:hypothetical protein